jgi:hypothetical protein
MAPEGAAVTDAAILAGAARELRERPGPLPASLNPLIADMLDQWARVGGWNPEQLHRLAGAEAIALARGIIGRPENACPTCGGDDDCHQLGCQQPTAMT